MLLHRGSSMCCMKALFTVPASMPSSTMKFTLDVF